MQWRSEGKLVEGRDVTIQILKIILTMREKLSKNQGGGWDEGVAKISQVHCGGGGGRDRSGKDFSYSTDLGICMSRMAKPCALLWWFGGMLPRENFLKPCNLVRFTVYFD